MSPQLICRRWFRFSLRTMFVLMTVACLWASCTKLEPSGNGRPNAVIIKLPPLGHSVLSLGVSGELPSHSNFATGREMIHGLEYMTVTVTDDRQKLTAKAAITQDTPPALDIYVSSTVRVELKVPEGGNLCLLKSGDEPVPSTTLSPGNYHFRWTQESR